MPKQLRIIIAGGGTGGHIFPAIAVAQAIQKLQPTAAILFVGAKGKMEMEKIPQAGFQIEGLTIAGLNRTNMFKNISLPFKLIKSFFQVRRIFNNFKPNAVFGVGGYSSFPVLKFAQTKNIPTFIHEANAFAGKSNQWLGKNATMIFTGTSGMENFFPAQKIQVTGNPVRQSIVDAHISKEASLLKFGLLPDRLTILIIGGSLGAASINKAVMNHLPKFKGNTMQLIWQTGKPSANVYVNAASEYANIYVNSFIDDMSSAYTAADIVVSRSGAMAVAEICITGKACVFVPYPFAAEDHQTYNAMQLVKEDAAYLVKDEEANEKLIPVLMSLVQDNEMVLQMQSRIKKFARIDADNLIAKSILNNIENANN
ncbi:MAG: undecaprenyldiphospho-muramoylpentapeptide beta-N-acetylglucosaminyltransferase [Bacteroidota bacterium]|jgi:UDP-N-acetylglucosamine--N-acetylmuramyl-(pentapeptide) pyrophosphoryl-undecaprenol N-acetylglucosamine transferase